MSAAFKVEVGQILRSFAAVLTFQCNPFAAPKPFAAPMVSLGLKTITKQFASSHSITDLKLRGGNGGPLLPCVKFGQDYR